MIFKLVMNFVVIAYLSTLHYALLQMAF